MRLSHHVARFWLRPGVLWPVKLAVKSPPPFEYEVAVAAPMRIAWHREEQPYEVAEPPYHTIRFRLTDYSPSGDVCHYELIPSCRPGWRYIFDGPRIIAERVGVVVTRRRAKAA